MKQQQIQKHGFQVLVLDAFFICLRAHVTKDHQDQDDADKSSVQIGLIEDGYKRIHVQFMPQVEAGLHHFKGHVIDVRNEAGKIACKEFEKEEERIEESIKGRDAISKLPGVINHINIMAEMRDGGDEVDKQLSAEIDVSSFPKDRHIKQHDEQQNAAQYDDPFVFLADLE